MAALVLTTVQSQFMTALEQPFLDSFGDGVVLPGGTPATIPGFKGFNDFTAEIKTNALNGIKSTFAPLVKVLTQAPTYTDITVFLNGFSALADPNYSGGKVRLYKDPLGNVHVQGLMSVPSAGSVVLDAFTLPVGFRPAAGDNMIFACAAGPTDVFAAIEVRSTGIVANRTTIPNSSWVSLNFQFHAGG